MHTASRLVALAASLPLLSAAPGAYTASAAMTLSAQVAPSGTLRAGINYNNPLLARRDSTSGELSGVAVDLARELARRLNVPVELIPYDAAGKMGDAAKSRAWDVAFLGIDAARASDIDFTAAYLELEGTYLVPPGSPLQSIDDVDRAGVRIAVTAKSAYDLFLSRTLKQAQIVRADTTPQSVEMMVADKLDAVAAVRTALVTAARQVPGSRILNGRFMTIPQAAGVPKGRPVAARYVSEYIEEMKSSGFVAQALTRHGLRPNDAIIAPPVALSREAMHVVSYLEVQPGASSAARTAIENYVQASRAEPGGIATMALQEIQRPERFVVVESWRDAIALAEHEQAESGKALLQALRGIETAPLDRRVNHPYTVALAASAASRDSLYVVTHVDVPGARRAEAEALLQKLAAPTRSERGHVRYDVHQQREPRMNHFTVFEQWSNRAAFDAHSASPHAREYRQALSPMLGALYDERLYRRVDR